jgi:hypothetical protein
VSVRRPYVDAVFTGACQVLSRSLPPGAPGVVAIRSSTSKADRCGAADRVRAYLGTPVSPAPRGSIVGLVDVVSAHELADCLMTGPCAVQADGTSFAKFIPEGPEMWHWVLADPRPLAHPVETVHSDSTRHEHIWQLSAADSIRVALAFATGTPVHSGPPLSDPWSTR